ncbi:general substrate transporter [Penicillium hispanicum]|uniref:general substrate transporter n=1 Tax=Penicillium hispanicum TaxID=1080232 RepID=UPI00253FF510|nr:general substrate transporter [Penicillium hispanicum]KAJ5579803.1 general substrate transporter [Penicillium hispanicum]
MAGWKDLRSFRQTSWNLGLAIIVMALSVFSFGFDNSVFSNIQAMDAYEKKFGSYDPQTKEWGFTAQHLAFLNALGLPAKCVGALLGGFIAERFGRRVSYIAMQFIVIAGIAVCYSAKNYGGALAGRIIVQLFVGWDNFLVPMFLAEISPTALRGAIVVVYVFAHLLGSLICSFVTLRTAKYAGDSSWQVPLGSMFTFPFFVLVFCWFIPESPRWLVRKGKHAHAVRQLRWLRAPFLSEEDAEVEVSHLQQSIDQDHETKGRWSDFLQGNNPRRLRIAIAVAILNQVTGQSFMSQYGAIFIKSLKTISPFTFSSIAIGITCIGPIITFSLVDTIGRRIFYLGSGSACVVVLFICGGLGTGNVSTSDKTGIVAVCAMFGFFYIMSFGGMGAVTAAEVPNLRLRDKSALVVAFMQFIFDFIVTFTLPYLLDAGEANLQSKVGFIYGACGLIGLVWAYFYLPDMTGRSLEELEEMFAAKVPARAFRKWKSNSSTITNEPTKITTYAKADPENI